MDNGVIRKVKGMLVTAFLCHGFFLHPHVHNELLGDGSCEQAMTNVSEQKESVVAQKGDEALTAQNEQPKVLFGVEKVKYRPSLHEQFYIKCDDEYFARVVSFLKTASHEEVQDYLDFVADTLTLKPRSEIVGYDDLYLDNAGLVLNKLFTIFERCFVDAQTGKITVSDDVTQKASRSNKKLLDYYLESHIKEALLFYLVCADYSISFINFYLMLPSLTSQQYQDMCYYHDGPLTLIISSKLPLWQETGDEPQSIKNYYEEAYKRIGECIMTGLRTKVEQKSS